LPLEGIARFHPVTEDATVKREPLPKDENESQLLRTQRVAAVLNWHPGSVRRAIRQGRIKAVRVGQQWRVSTEELARMQNEGLPQ
jgi:excisionase family DNA binding protein